MVKLIIGIITIANILLGCDQISTQHQQASTSQATAPETSHNTAQPKEAIAKVGDHFFTEADIDAEFLRMPDSVKKMQQQTSMRTNLLKNIMTRYALVEQAKQKNINDDPLVKARIDSITASILIQALNKKMRNELSPSEDDVRKYYNEHQQQYQQARQWHVRHILLKDEATANEVLQSLKNGSDFATLAAQKSQDTASAKNGGELPLFHRGEMGAVIEQAIQKLNVNSPLSNVVHSPLGYQIIQWLNSIPAGIRAFGDVKVQITTQLQQQRFRDWVEQIKKNLDYEIIDAKYRLPDVRSPISQLPLKRN